MKEVGVFALCMLGNHLIVLGIGFIFYAFWGEALSERVVALESTVARYEKLIEEDEQR